MHFTNHTITQAQPLIPDPRRNRKQFTRSNHLWVIYKYGGIYKDCNTDWWEASWRSANKGRDGFDGAINAHESDRDLQRVNVFVDLWRPISHVGTINNRVGVKFNFIFLLLRKMSAKEFSAMNKKEWEIDSGKIGWSHARIFHLFEYIINRVLYYTNNKELFLFNGMFNTFHWGCKVIIVRFKVIILKHFAYKATLVKNHYQCHTIIRISVYIILVKLPVQLSNLFVSVALICFVLYFKKIIWSKMYILYCLVLLNSILFLTLFVLNQQNTLTTGFDFPSTQIVNLKVSKLNHTANDQV